MSHTPYLVASPEHGTLQGYREHTIDREEPCNDCRTAVNALYVSLNGDGVYLTSEGLREARKHQNGKEPYTRDEILSRDDYTCHICLIKVDLNASSQIGVGDWKLYPHMDHVIPVSKGGPDTPANVKTAHAYCNILKGNRH